MNTLHQAIEFVRQTALLESTQATLEWDQQTGLPAQAGEYRAQQVELLSGMIHRRRTDAQFGRWLEELLEQIDSLEIHEQVLVRKLFRDFHRHRRLPCSLVQQIASATVRGQQAWGLAKPQGDFGRLRPHLEEIFELRIQEAECLREGNQSRYDALLDQYEEGACTQEIEKVFSSLRADLIALRQRLSASTVPPQGTTLHGEFPVEQQKAASRWIAEQIGFCFQRGRLDETKHPFCTTLGPHDHRILTRYHPTNFASGFFGTLHEAGHGLYEQGLPSQWFGLPLGAATSLGIHESQSRFWENMVGRSLPFWTWCLPHLAQRFSGLGMIPVRQVYCDLNRSFPSLIRVEADEATYNLHILARFELEQALISGRLKVGDLPEAWNRCYLDYLGIQPCNDREGVLQDIHWSAGLIGYFPTYTLGNLYAAHWMAAVSKELGATDELLANGQFSELLVWLRRNVHCHGRRYSSRDLLRQATGEELSARPFLDYLSNKLLDVYGLA